MNLPLLGEDSLVLGTDVVGDFYGCGAVGLADELDLFGGGLACTGVEVLAVVVSCAGVGGGGVPKLLVRRTENSPEGGGAIERGMLGGLRDGDMKFRGCFW